MKVLPHTFLLVAFATIAAEACGPAAGSTKTDCEGGAPHANIDDTAGIFSINGGPASGPNGVNTCVPVQARAVPGINFDFAVDVNDSQAFVLPPYLVSASRLAGWYSTTQPYDAVSDAPTYGYNDSMPLLIAPGSVFLIQSFQRTCTVLPSTTQHYIYSKFIIDSIHYYAYDGATAPAGQTVYYRMRNDPICGYTSLAPGAPQH